MSEKIYEGLIRDELASESGHSKAFIRQFSIEFFQAIREGLLEDGHVRLHQFGSFKLKWSQQRKGINPQTGEAITIAAHPRIIFTAAKHLKDEVNASLAPAVIASSIINPVINSKPEAVPEPIEPAETPDKARKPLPKLETEPYLNRPDNPTDNSNNESQISYRAMAAGFVLICSVSYFLLPDFRQETPSVNNHTAITSDIQKPNNVVQATTVTTAPVETAVDLASTTQTPEDVTEMSHTATIVEVKDARTNPVTLNPEQPDETDKAFFLSKKHKLVNGNSLWRLSKKNYINPFYWPHIYQANRYSIRNPDKLLIGKTITLPTLYGHPDNLTDADKRNIAEGYFLAYQYYKRKNAPYPYYALLGAAKYDPAIIQKYIYEIADEDWENLQLASNITR